MGSAGGKPPGAECCMCPRRDVAGMFGLRGPVNYPLVTAALVAVCGVSLIVFSSVMPASVPGSEPPRASRKQLHENHVQALLELRRVGVAGGVDVVDFGDGLGLGATQSLEPGDVLLSIPESLALGVDRARSCSSDAPPAVGSTEADPLDCRVERVVVQAVAQQEVTRLTGLIALLVMERRRGLVPGLEPAATSAVLAVLPEPAWVADNGIFALDPEEFRVLGVGTSMEGWRDAAVNATNHAHAFLQKSLEPFLGEITLEEVRWAYLVLHAHGQWVEDDGLDDGIEFPDKVLFLWPFLLARSTPEWGHGVQLRYSPARRAYEATVTRSLYQGDEVLFVDRRLSDASALCFRGLWLNGQHRARISLDVSGVPRDPLSQPLLQKYGCGTQPLRFYLQARKVIDPHFLSCMRLLALAGNVSRVERVERNGWMNAWPDTSAANRQSEAAAADLAISSLQQALQRLGGSGADIRQRFGSDPLAARPTMRVREAETMIVVSLLKSMKELQLLSGNEYLFEALRDSQKKTQKKKKQRQQGFGATAAWTSGTGSTPGHASNAASSSTVASQQTNRESDSSDSASGSTGAASDSDGSAGDLNGTPLQQQQQQSSAESPA